MGIPEEDTAWLDGTVLGAKREQVWRTRRVFYCTPQTFENDMKNGNCDPKQIVCLVFDEAHKAKGNYAYTSIINRIMDDFEHKKFRILALSASPGIYALTFFEISI